MAQYEIPAGSGRPDVVEASTRPATQGYVAVRADLWESVIRRLSDLEYELSRLDNRIYNAENNTL